MNLLERLKKAYKDAFITPEEEVFLEQTLMLRAQYGFTFAFLDVPASRVEAYKLSLSINGCIRGISVRVYRTTNYTGEYGLVDGITKRRGSLA